MKNFGLENLTDKELLGQLLCLEISGCKDRDEIISIIKENKPGAIYVNNFESKEIKEITEIVNSVTKYPVLVVADVEHGPAGVFKDCDVELPNPMAWGACDDESLVERAGELTGKIARKLGVHLSLSPVVDINLNKNNPLVNIRCPSKTAVNGTYVFYAVDGFRNRSDTCYMYMSIDAPEATIVKSDNSHKVCVIWTASNCYATLNGKSYTSGTWIEQEGEYTFIVTNDANRSTTYKFTVDHYYARYSMVAPTCTQKGYTIYKCTGCGDSYDGDFIEAKGHDYESKIVKPTCTAQGYTRYTCKTCGNTYTDNFIEAEGHRYGEWTTVKEPTCVDLGKDERTCSVCSYVDERDTDALGHNYKAKIVEPTCLEQGYTTHICSRCGTGYNDTFVPQLGHDYEKIEVAPTCTEEGYRGKKCRRCEDCVKTEILKAVGHKFTDSYFIATCEDEGYTLHTCLSCGNEYKDNIVPATGHDYETEVVREPHCEMEGERKFHCTKCEKEYYSDIPATGHNYELTGTEEVNGENIRTYVCTNCGAITTQNMGEQYEQVSSYIGYLFGQYQSYMWWVLLATESVAKGKLK